MRGSSRSPTPSASSAASGSATTPGSSTATGGVTAGSRSTAQNASSPGPLAFAECMRANGVPNFPDPNPGGGFDLSAAVGPSGPSPAFQAAQAKCQKLIGVPGGPGGPSFSPQVKAQSLAKLRKIAVCMRAHGVSEFPDPSTTRPSSLADSGAGVLTDFDGVFLAFPSTLDLQAPAYKEALAACGAPPLGLPH